MNEHDSERIAGSAGGRGHGGGRRLDDADVVVLNTCCIRENADNKLYGAPRPAQGAEGRAPRPADRGGRLPGPEGPGADRRAGRPRGRGLRHPQPGPRPGAAGRAGPARGTGAWRSSRSTRRIPSALPARREVDHPAWVTIQIGCDNSCAFCIVPSVRGAEVSRRLGRHRPRGRGAGRRRRRRDHAAGPERQLLRAGPRRRAVAARSSPTCCGRSTPSTGIRRVRFTSPHPKDLRPETIAAMAECPIRVRAPAPPPAVGQRPDAGAHAPRLHRRALPGAAGRGARRDPATSRSPPTSSSASPARPTRTSSARSRSSTRPSYDAAYTFVFSPRPGTEAAADGRRLRRPPRSRRRSASPRLEELVERARRAQPRGAGRPGRGDPGRGPVEEGPDVLPGRTRQNKLVHFAAATAPLRRAPSPTSAITAAAAHWLRGELVGHRPAAPRRIRIPVTAGWVGTPVTRTSPSSGRPPPGSPRSAWRSPGALGDVEIVSIDSMQVYRGMDIGTAKPTAAERAAVPHHSSTSPIPWEDWSVARFQAEARAARRRHRSAGPPGAAARRHRALRAGGRRRSAAPRRGPRAAGRARRPHVRGAGRAGRALPRARPSATRSPPPGSSPATPAGSSGRSRSSGHRAAVLVVRPRSGRVRRHGVPRADRRACGCPGPRPRRASTTRFDGDADAGLVDEVRRARRRPGGWSRTARQAIGYKEMLADLRRRRARPRGGAATGRAPHPGASPAANGLVPPGSPHRLVRRPRRNRSRSSPALLAWW